MLGKLSLNVFLTCSAKSGVRPLPLSKLVDNFEGQYEYVANEGTIFTLRTNLYSPRYR